MNQAIGSVYQYARAPVRRARGRLFACCGPALCLVLAACGTSPSRPPSAAGAPPAGEPATAPAPHAPASGTARYRIDPSASTLRILVYRAGAMASLGHDHVILAHGLEGWAEFDGGTSRAAFVLEVPVSELSVDDAAARAEEGEAFAEPVTEQAKAGTLHNMLGPEVLNAAQFPRLILRSVRIEGGDGVYRARLVAQVAGHAASLEVPFTLAATPERLIASGEVGIRQSELGLTPFSVLLGALKVRDEIQVKFRLVAQRG